MLDAHPALAIPAETHFVPALLALPRSTTFAACAAVIDEAVSRDDFGFRPDELRADFGAVDEVDPADFLRSFYATYARRHRKPRWGDKTPTYLQSMDVIAAALPEACFVHLLRDARAVAASRRGLHFGPGASLRAQAQDWRDQIDRGREMGRALDHRYVELRYEDLVREPQASLESLAPALDLPFDPAMLDYHRSALERLGEMDDRRDRDGRVEVARDARLQIHERTTGVPDADRIDEWRDLLTSAEVDEIDEVAGDLLTELGYR
jgi:Sulfotransferase family